MFWNSHKCCLCGKETSWAWPCGMNTYICNTCKGHIGCNALPASQELMHKRVSALLSERKTGKRHADTFEVSWAYPALKRRIEIDEVRRKFQINQKPLLYNFSDLADVEIVYHEHSKSREMFASILDTRKIDTILEAISVKITFQHFGMEPVYIRFNCWNSRKNSSLCQDTLKKADQIVSALKCIKQKAGEEVTNVIYEPENNAVSPHTLSEEVEPQKSVSSNIEFKKSEPVSESEFKDVPKILLGCGGLLFIMMIIGALSGKPEKNDSPSPRQSAVCHSENSFGRQPVLLNVSEFNLISKTTLEQKLGAPLDVEHWNYKIASYSYPTVTYTYKIKNLLWEFMIIYDQVIRASCYGSDVPPERLGVYDTSNLFSLFGIEPVSDMKTVVENAMCERYRDVAAGIDEFWVTHSDDDELFMVAKITFDRRFFAGTYVPAPQTETEEPTDYIVVEENPVPSSSDEITDFQVIETVPPENDTEQQAAHFVKLGRTALQKGDLQEAERWANLAQSFNVIFDSGEDTPEKLLADIKEILAAVSEDTPEVSDKNPVYSPSSAYDLTGIKDQQEEYPVYDPTANFESVRNANIGTISTNMDPADPKVIGERNLLIVDARIALSKGDIAKAILLANQAGAMNILYNTDDDTHENVLKHIENFTITLNRLNAEGQTEEVRRMMAKTLLEQAQALLVWGKLDEAANLAMAAQNLGIQYYHYEVQPKDVLVRIENAKNQSEDRETASEIAAIQETVAIPETVAVPGTAVVPEAVAVPAGRTGMEISDSISGNSKNIPFVPRNFGNMRNELCSFFQQVNFPYEQFDLVIQINEIIHKEIDGKVLLQIPYYAKPNEKHRLFMKELKNLAAERTNPVNSVYDYRDYGSIRDMVCLDLGDSAWELPLNCQDLLLAHALLIMKCSLKILNAENQVIGEWKLPIFRSGMMDNELRINYSCRTFPDPNIKGILQHNRALTEKIYYSQSSLLLKDPINIQHIGTPYAEKDMYYFSMDIEYIPRPEYFTIAVSPEVYQQIRFFRCEIISENPEMEMVYRRVPGEKKEVSYSYSVDKESAGSISEKRNGPVAGVRNFFRLEN